MQADPAHDAVDHERDARQIAGVLHRRNEQKQQSDLRDEHDDVADAGDDAIDDQIAERTGRQRARDDVLQRGDAQLDQFDDRLRPGEQRLEQDQHHDSEDDKSPEAMGENGVDPLGPGRLHGRDTSNRARKRGIHVSVAAGDNLLVEVAPLRCSTAVHPCRGGADRGGHALQLVVQIVLERKQQPDGPRPLCGGRQRRHRIGDVSGEVPHV